MINIGIVGYGNLGKGVECEIKENEDMRLVAIFTRRNPVEVPVMTKDVKVVGFEEVENFKDKIDVMILCGGSATDLPTQGPVMARYFNTVDSFDNHGIISNYYNSVNEESMKSKKVNIISAGWDPGVFSLIRALTESILPVGMTYTFWGKGVSQGHSDAIRRIDGVKDAIEYTIPSESSINNIRNGEIPFLETKDKHTRECYVVAQENADKEKITNEIIEMPNYFADYNTKVMFISQEEMQKNHNDIKHGGYVFRTSFTGDMVNKTIVEFSLKTDSNPGLTASILIAYARAAYRLNCEGGYGAKTVFDIPINYLSKNHINNIVKKLL